MWFIIGGYFLLNLFAIIMLFRADSQFRVQVEAMCRAKEEATQKTVDKYKDYRDPTTGLLGAKKWKSE